MYLLYLDESGVHTSQNFVLAGFAIFERRTYWLASEIDKVQAHYLPNVSESLNFHVSDIRDGHDEPWRSLDKTTRYELIAKVYEAICAAEIILFGVAADKQFVARDELARQSIPVNPLVQKFDTSEGVIHGLLHLTSQRETCPCPACISRRLARS